MPPRRPSMPKSTKSVRARQAKIILNFSSTATILQTLSTENQLVEEGYKQEGQGERYQFDEKALRHYKNAIVCHQAITTINPTSFDSLYNAARIYFIVATEFLAQPDCLHALVQAIESYRRALELLIIAADARIDCESNLATALVALATFIDEGAHSIPSDPPLPQYESQAMPARLEAASLFRSVESLQRIEMAKSGLGTSIDDIADDYDDLDVPALTQADAQTTETRMVVPAQIIAIILEALDNDIEIIDHYTPGEETVSSAEAPIEGVPSLESIVHSLTRAVALRDLIPIEYATEQQDIALQLAQLTISALFSPTPHLSALIVEPAQIEQRYQLLQTTYPKNVEILSNYADYLISLASEQVYNLHFSEKSLQALVMAAALLADPFRDRIGVPGHTIPILQSANHTAQAEIYKEQYLKTKEDSMRLKAVEESIKAAEIVGVGYRFALEKNGEYSVGKGVGRNDWAAVRAGREAVTILQSLQSS